MGDGLALQLWRLLPIEPTAMPEVWACSRFNGCCEVVARNERQARLLAAGAFCLPVAPEHCKAVCPWLSPTYVLAELAAQSVPGPAGVVPLGLGPVVLSAAAGEVS
ncbi:hypothetical protein [Plastoroseomonas hellenica]|uniref:hypothetical protein n=1 Tax=Plastoroseomonas hellenica TaxID=2687306 RepID=UPI001BA8E593|nr:hypothetical protein [Plastoroseomonas hellenica]MBR0645569.1 hypothetical protein [Plastoroseomonas hellenica]